MSFIHRVITRRANFHPAVRTLIPAGRTTRSQNIAARCLSSTKGSKPSEDPPISKEGDHSHQYAWNTFAAMALGVGVAAGFGVYMKLKNRKPKVDKPSEAATPAEPVAIKPDWEDEKKLLQKLPDRIPYLIVGAGTAAFSAARSIRSRNPTAQVLLVGEEPYSPYMRPPLSKELWLTPTSGDAAEGVQQPAFLQWNGRARSVFLERPQFFCSLDELSSRDNGGIVVGSGMRVVSLNPRKQSVVIMPASADIDSDNAPKREIFYDRCLLATGGKPRVLPKFDQHIKSGKVSLFRNITDYQKLSAVADKIATAPAAESPSIVVVGGGFLGSELAFALAWRAKQSNSGYKVYQVIRERGVLDQVLPTYLSSWTADRLAEAGVQLVSGVDVSKIKDEKSGLALKLSDGKELKASHVVLATGIVPNTQLAEEAGLEVDAHIGGIAVNSELMARNNLWAAGDVSSFYDPRLRARRRVEHHDQAIVSGRLAGENMAGAAKVYSQQAMFWSDLGPSVSFEAVGLIDAKLQTYAVFAEPEKKASEESSSEEKVNEDFKRGVVFYLSSTNEADSRRLVGILLWNLPGRLGVTRRLLKDQPILDDIDGGVAKLTEMARILQINDDDSELMEASSPENENEDDNKITPKDGDGDNKN